MSIWSDHFENRDPAARPWQGDEWSNGEVTWKIVGVMISTLPKYAGQLLLVTYDDSSLGRCGMTGGTWKREIKKRNLRCTLRLEDRLSPETIAELKTMESP